MSDSLEQNKETAGIDSVLDCVQKSKEVQDLLNGLKLDINTRQLPQFCIPKVGQWVKVEDFLPPFLQDVIVYDGSNNVVAYLDSINNYEPVFYDGHAQKDVESVKFWMGLPEMPRALKTASPL